MQEHSIEVGLYESTHSETWNSLRVPVGRYSIKMLKGKMMVQQDVAGNVRMCITQHSIDPRQRWLKLGWFWLRLYFRFQYLSIGSHSVVSACSTKWKTQICISAKTHPLSDTGRHLNWSRVAEERYNPISVLPTAWLPNCPTDLTKSGDIARPTTMHIAFNLFVVSLLMRNSLSGSAGQTGE